jgi:hypothetical protein
MCYLILRIVRFNKDEIMKKLYLLLSVWCLISSVIILTQVDEKNPSVKVFKPVLIYTSNIAGFRNIYIIKTIEQEYWKSLIIYCRLNKNNPAITRSQETFVFNTDLMFETHESVNYYIISGVKSLSEQNLSPLTYSFNVSQLKMPLNSYTGKLLFGAGKGAERRII